MAKRSKKLICGLQVESDGMNYRTVLEVSNGQRFTLSVGSKSNCNFVKRQFRKALLGLGVSITRETKKTPADLVLELKRKAADAQMSADRYASGAVLKALELGLPVAPEELKKMTSKAEGHIQQFRARAKMN
jgi:hypothetical protein